MQEDEDEDEEDENGRYDPNSDREMDDASPVDETSWYPYSLSCVSSLLFMFYTSFLNTLCLQQTCK